MIVKNLMVVGVIAGFAGVAAAAEEAKVDWKVSGKVRMDNVQTSTETKDGDSAKTTAKESEIKLNRAQFKLTGTRGETDKLEISVRADKWNTTDLADSLDYASITHKFSDMLSVSFGKLAVLALSWENDYSSVDEYFVSAAGNLTPLTANGVQADATFGDHSLSLQVLQGETSVKDGDGNTWTFNKSGGLTTSLQYRGEINKMIRPLIGYTLQRPSSTKGTSTVKVTDTSTGKTTDTKVTGTYKDGLTTQIGAGVQVAVADATIDAEYDMVTQNKFKYTAEGSSEEQESKAVNVNSIVFQAKYAIGMTSPFVKFSSDTTKKGANDGIGDITGTNIGLGVEHKLDPTCRLHAVYYNSATSEKAAGSTTKKVTASTFNLGVTASI